MVEFDRTAAILSELISLDDPTTAHLADIAFTAESDHGVCRDLREALAREYRDGKVGGRDWYETAAIVAADVASRGNQLLRFAAVSDITTTCISTSPYDEEDMVIVDYGDSLGDVVAAALRFRFKRAAYQLVAYLEDHHTHQAIHRERPGVSDTDTDATSGEPPIF